MLAVLPFAVVVATASRLVQQPVTRGEFVQLRGTDTVSVERFTRDAQSLAGEFFQLGLHVRYTAQLRADHTVQHFEFTAERSGNLERGRLDFTTTRIQGERSIAGVTSAVDVATRTPALPLFVGSTALVEQIVRATRPSPGQDANVPVFRLFVVPAGTDTILLRRIDRDSVLLLAPEGEVRLAIANDGSISGVSGLARRARLERRALSSVSLAGLFPPTSPPFRPIESREVYPDRTVTLRLYAPRAAQVTVNFAGSRHVMTKDSSGVWSITVGPVTPDLYSYRFTIDGVGLADPDNPSALIEVAGTEPFPWSVRSVPHGAVTEVWYHSRALGGAFRSVTVYTPPGYEASTERLPVLYLLHGAGGVESSWLTQGRANLVLDNLIADGRARPMIVVMPFGHVEQTTKLGLSAAGEIPASSTFSDDLLGDLIPMLEQRFRIAQAADQHAIAGLSMGGVQAIEIGLSHLDRFHWIAGFSSALYVPAYSSFPVQRRLFSLSPADVAAMNKQIKLLWIACGKDDGLLANNERFVNTMNARGLRHTFVITEGDHEWKVWRQNLAELVPLLFKR